MLNKLKYLFYNERKTWRIGIVLNSLDEILNNIAPTIRWSTNIPKNTYQADPILFSYQNMNYLFFEVYDYRKGKGHLAFVEEVNETFDLSSPTKFLETDYHLAYPYVFEDNTEIYCLPEEHKSQQLNLYKAVNFPYEWKFESSLFEGQIADPTLLKHDNLYWIFYTIENSTKIPNSELHLAYSESLTGVWIKHPLNPIVKDPTNARPGGNIFIYNGNFYRPAQDCKDKYGNKLIINKITTINREDYKEEFVTTIEPDQKFAEGTHTLAVSSKHIIIDGRKFEYSLKSPNQVIQHLKTHLFK